MDLRAERGSHGAGYFAHLSALVVFLGTIHGSPQALAHGSCASPGGFDGRAYYILDGGRAISDAIEVAIASQNQYGIFVGTFSRYSPFPEHPEELCQEAVNVPLEGFCDGYRLSLHIKQSVKSTLCRDYDMRLTRRADRRFLSEGLRWHIELIDRCPN